MPAQIIGRSRDEDISLGLKSTAILFGKHDLLILRILKTLMIALLLVLGMKLQLAWPWFAGVAVAAGLFAWHQKLVLRREREACFKAFLNNNWVGVAILAGLIASYSIA